MCTIHTILVAELVRGPDTAVAVGSMDSINESVRLGLLCVLARVVRVTQKSRRHAGPESEDDKGQQVAHGHCSSPSLINVRSEMRHQAPPLLHEYALAELIPKSLSGPRRRDVVQHDEKEDGSGNVDERVGPVRPSHESRILKEPRLHCRLDEDAELLLEMDYLECMFPSGIDSRFLESYCSEGTSKLVNLR